MASAWVNKQHIIIKNTRKARNESGANLEQRILCLQKSGANIAKMAFLEIFANFDKKYHFYQNLPGQDGTSIIEAIYVKKSTSIILALKVALLDPLRGYWRTDFSPELHWRRVG